MARNPGSDLLSDALLAAEPQQARAAAEKLAKLAASDSAVAAAFEDALAGEPAVTPSAGLRGPLSVSIGSQGLHGGKPANPYEQFEATMLKSFFETMLPSKANAIFGSGLAGDVWKSMFAEALANAVSRTKSVGVAKELEARARRPKS
jgi:flagellar protein FlgJ